MERPIKTLADVRRLLAAADLVSSSVKTVVAEWAKETETAAADDPHTDATVLPSPELYEAQRVILGATGVLTELVAESHARVIEMACQYWESRALFVAVERRIPDLIAMATPALGVSVTRLAEQTGIEAKKLSRILRCLTSAHIFKEVATDVFANNAISASLVKNEHVRAYCLMFNLDLYTASDHLPRYLLGADGHSYAVDKTPFQKAVGTTKPRWEWLEEVTAQTRPRTSTHDDHGSNGLGYPGMPGHASGASAEGSSPRPEHEVFGLAMVGGGKVFGVAHLYDYPWAELGSATIVDVGGGAGKIDLLHSGPDGPYLTVLTEIDIGGFDLQLSKVYPNLSFVVQDRGPVLEQARTIVWPKENPEALAQGRVRFVEHDFFQPNPTPGADVYWLRYILHDWSDDYCVKILGALKAALTKSGSRILVCDQVMDTTLGCEELQPAPFPLPANYGYSVRYSHQRDLAMMGIINGIERTPQQFKQLVEAAGLETVKIWSCRSQVSIVEIRRPTIVTAADS